MEKGLEDTGIEIVERNGMRLLIGGDKTTGLDQETGWFWLNRKEFDTLLAEIRELSPGIEFQAARELVIATVMERLRKRAAPETAAEPETAARSAVNEIYVVKIAKRARQFQLFAEAYAKQAVLRADGMALEWTGRHVAAAEQAWLRAKAAADRAALAAVAAVKSEEVAEAVRVAALEAEAELRCSADAAQTALDEANRIIRGEDERPSVVITSLDADVEPFYEKIRQCLEDTSRAAGRAELFAGYARTYVQMAALKTISVTGDDVGRQALRFAETAAKAAARAMMAADEARLCAEKAGRRKFFAKEEKQRLDRLLQDAESRARTALAVAVEAAAGTGAEVLRE
ncbi:MAG: hypothetical protein ACOZF0_09655 [Thermodesulfobacteriota bacterium]